MPEIDKPLNDWPSGLLDVVPGQDLNLRPSARGHRQRPSTGNDAWSNRKGVCQHRGRRVGASTSDASTAPGGGPTRGIFVKSMARRRKRGGKRLSDATGDADLRRGGAHLPAPPPCGRLSRRPAPGARSSQDRMDHCHHAVRMVNAPLPAASPLFPPCLAYPTALRAAVPAPGTQSPRITWTGTMMPRVGLTKPCTEAPPSTLRRFSASNRPASAAPGGGSRRGIFLKSMARRRNRGEPAERCDG